VRISGSLLRDISNDVPSAQPIFSKADALAQGKALANATATENEQATLYVQLGQSSIAQLIYLVSFIKKDATVPSRPYYMITGVVLDKWEGIAYREATGPGGNNKTGKYEYGTNLRTFDCRQ
jgi:Zn-dependent metalloprotease